MRESAAALARLFVAPAYSGGAVARRCGRRATIFKLGAQNCYRGKRQARGVKHQTARQAWLVAKYCVRRQRIVEAAIARRRVDLRGGNGVLARRRPSGSYNQHGRRQDGTASQNGDRIKYRISVCWRPSRQ